MKDWPTVRVVWTDSTLLDEGTWMDIEDLGEDELTTDAMLQEDVGYVIAESPVAIALAGSKNASTVIAGRNGTRVGSVRIIPKKCIVERHELMDRPRRKR